MAINYKHYTYRVSWSRDDQEYVATCVEFPSLSFLADSSSAALKGIRDLVADVVQDMQNNQEDVPIPYAERAYSGKFQVRITPDQHRMLAIEAAEQGVSLNRYIAAKL